MISIPLTDLEAKTEGGKLRTASLFFETNDTSYPAYFTTKDYDHTFNDVEYLSLKKIYLSIADVTEYQFALAVFGRWKQWERIQANKEFSSMVDEWRTELELQIRSSAIQNIKEIADTDGAKGMAAAKFLAEKGWNNAGSKRGRPTKLEVARERKLAAHLKSDTDDDATRIGLKH